MIDIFCEGMPIFDAHLFFLYLHGRFQFDTSKMCMVGDRLDTDILFGQNAGCKTLLVLSGLLQSRIICLDHLFVVIYASYQSSMVEMIELTLNN